MRRSWHELSGVEEVRAGLEDAAGSRRVPTDSERIVSIQATPFSRSPSNGTVISCSTSAAESPSASVWIATYGGVNSGSRSTGASRSCATPTTMVPAAAITTRSRKVRLHSTICATAPPCCLHLTKGYCGAIAVWYWPND